MSNRSDRKAEHEAANRRAEKLVPKNVPSPPDPDNDIAPLPQPEAVAPGELAPVKLSKEDQKIADAHEKYAGGAKVIAHDVKTGRREKEDHVTTPETGSPIGKNEVEGKPARGALYVAYRGHHYGPVACGVHRSEPTVFETSTDDLPEDPPGFQPNCDDCVAELDSTLDHARRTTFVPPAPVKA